LVARFEGRHFPSLSYQIKGSVNTWHPTIPLFLQTAFKVLSSERPDLQEMEHANAASRRLQAVSNHTSIPSNQRKKNTPARLARCRKVNTALAEVVEDPSEMILNGSVVIYTVSEFQEFALRVDVTSVAAQTLLALWVVKFSGCFLHSIL